MSDRRKIKGNTDALGPKVKEILRPEMCKLAEALSTVLGFRTFDDYVAACIKTNVQMFIEGGADIYERFHDSYGHLGYEFSQEKKKEPAKREEKSVIVR